MLNRICSWLIRNLGISDLRNKLHNLDCRIDNYSRSAGDIERRVGYIEGLVDVGIDVSVVNHNSWAIVCVGGKPEYVKFFIADTKELREVQQFIKKFSRNRTITDCPPFFRDMLKEI